MIHTVHEKVIKKKQLLFLNCTEIYRLHHVLFHINKFLTKYGSVVFPKLSISPKFISLIFFLFKKLKSPLKYCYFKTGKEVKNVWYRTYMQQIKFYKV